MAKPKATKSKRYRAEAPRYPDTPVPEPVEYATPEDGGYLSEDTPDEPGAWEPAQFPSSQPSPAIQGPSYRSTANPVEAAQNQRDMTTWRGDKLNQQSEDDYWNAAGREKDYAGRIDPVAQNWMDGGGGYNDDERARIYQDGREGENYLTPEEQAASQGDAASWERFYNPEGSEGAQRESAALQRGSAERLDQRVSQAVNPDQLRQSEGYRSRSQQALKDNRKGTWDTIISNADNVRGVLGESGENVRGSLDSTGDNVRGAIDPSAVTTSQGFLDDYNLDPREKQDIIESAGISAGTGYRAATGELQRKALAAGANPMGVAAYRARNERAAAGEAGDAMTKARVAASQEEARRQLTGEELRTQGGRYLTDTRVGSELDLGRQRTGAELDLGRQRSAAEQSMGSQAIDTQRRLGENETAQINAEEDNRQGAERYLTDASTRAAQIGQGAVLDTEGNINNQQRQVGQFNTTTGTDIARGQDTASSDRAYRAGTNRQGVSLTNQERASQRGQTVGNARINQQNAGMEVLQQQGQQQNTNAQNARQRQQQTYGTQTSGTNTATAIGAQADNAAKSRPGVFDKVMGAVSAAAPIAASFLADGGIVGLNGPELIVAGEAGPEKVEPLTYRANAKVRPSLGGVLDVAGKFAGGMAGKADPYQQAGQGIAELVGAIKSRRDLQRGSRESNAAVTAGIDKALSTSPYRAGRPTPVAPPMVKKPQFYGQAA
jgi:hypothetical protein